MSDLKVGIEITGNSADAVDAVAQANKAMQDLGVKSDASLNDTAQASKKAYDTLKQSGTASARELQIAFQKMATDAIAANGGVASSYIKAEAAARGLAIGVDAQGGAIVKSMGEVKSGVDSAAQKFDLLKNQMLQLVGIGVGTQAIKDLAALADSYKNLEARIALVTGEGAAFDAALEGVHDVAVRTNSDLTETGNLFAKLAQAGKELGYGNAQALKLTETINQSIQLSGASADASNAAITQLVQGLGSGVLRGDEFNSVMEQSPRLAQALAEGLGVTTGQLREMANAGQLSSAVVIGALQKQADVINGEFAKMPQTVGRAMQNLSTEFQKFIGETDKAGGYSAKLAGAIELLSGNLSTVASVMLHAGETLGAMKLLNMAMDWLKFNQSVVAGTAATAENTAATVQNSTARKANAAAATAQAGAVAEAAAAQRAGAAAAQAQALEGAAAARSVGMLGGAFAAVKAAALPMLALDIALNFRSYGTAIGEAAAQLMGYKDRTDELAKSDRALQQMQEERIAALKQQKAATEAAMAASFGLTEQGKKLTAQFDEEIKKGNSAAEAIKSIGKDFDLANMPGIKNAVPVLDNLLTQGKITATQFQAAWAEALKGKDLAVFEVQARAALDGTARGAEQLAQVMRATLGVAVERTGLDMGLISNGMGTAAASAINDTQRIVAGLESLKSQGIDTQKVLVASIGKGLETADSVKAVKEVQSQIESLRKVLGDKITDGFLDQAKQKLDALKDAADKATPGINSVKEAMRQLGVTSDAALQETAAKSREAYETIRSSGTASTREVAAAFQKFAQDAIAANGGVATETLRVQAEMLGLEVQAGKTGDSIVRAMDGASASTGKAADATQRLLQLQQQQKPGGGGGGGGGTPTVNYANGGGRGDRNTDGNGLLPGQTGFNPYLGSSGNDMRAVDNSGLDSLKQKAASGTLTAADLATAQAVFAAAKTNLTTMQQNAISYSLEGQRSVQQAYTAAQVLLQKIQAMQQQQQQSNGNGNGNGNGANYTVTFKDQSGQNTTATFDSDAQAQAFLAMLKKSGMAA